MPTFEQFVEFDRCMGLTAFRVYGLCHYLRALVGLESPEGLVGSSCVTEKCEIKTTSQNGPARATHGLTSGGDLRVSGALGALLRSFQVF